MVASGYPARDLQVDNAVAHTVAAYGFAHHYRKRRGGERPCDLELVQGPPQALDMPTLVDQEGRITEGSSTNAWIVTADGKVVTRPADNGILRGITRSVLIDAVKAQGLVFEERAFTISEALGAREAFVTAASQIVMPVVRIDGRLVGNGKPGPVATALRRDFHRHAEWA